MKIYLYVLTLGFGHLLVDMISSVLFLHFVNIRGGYILGYVFLMVIYLGLAFAIQPVLGLLVDHFNLDYRRQTIYSCLLLGLSCIIFFDFPLIAICLACFANSLYHVAAGAAVLKISQNKSFYGGLFVAPGTLGILFSQLLGVQTVFPFWTNFLPILFFSLVVTFMRFPMITISASPVQTVNKKVLALSLFCVIVLIRSLGGFVVLFPWKTEFSLLLLLTIAIFLGKALGGLVADRFGWRTIGIISLLASAPLITFGSVWPVLAIPGMLLFNFTMPITLMAANNLYPNRPGFIFGLITFMVSVGTFPLLTGTTSLYSAPVLFTIILIAAIPLVYGLNLLPSLEYTRK